jgi:DNA-binding response OmpR family regulator
MWGHEVRLAHDGPSALEASRDFRPQVVLLDIGLPGLTGPAGSNSATYTDRAGGLMGWASRQ